MFLRSWFNTSDRKKQHKLWPLHIFLSDSARAGGLVGGSYWVILQLRTQRLRCWSRAPSLEYQILFILFERNPRKAERIKEINHKGARVSRHLNKQASRIPWGGIVSQKKPSGLVCESRLLMALSYSRRLVMNSIEAGGGLFSNGPVVPAVLALSRAWKYHLPADLPLPTAEGHYPSQGWKECLDEWRRPNI